MEKCNYVGSYLQFLDACIDEGTHKLAVRQLIVLFARAIRVGIPKLDPDDRGLARDLVEMAAHIEDLTSKNTDLRRLAYEGAFEKARVYASLLDESPDKLLHIEDWYDFSFNSKRELSKT